MGSDTQFNHLNTCLSIAKDSFSAMKSFRLSHENCMEYLETHLYEHNSYIRLAQWRKAYIDGYVRALWDNIYRYDLIYMTYFRGQWIPAGELDKHPDWIGYLRYTEYVKRCEAWGLKPNGHFWKEIRAHDKGIPRRFY